MHFGKAAFLGASHNYLNVLINSFLNKPWPKRLGTQHGVDPFQTGEIELLAHMPKRSRCPNDFPNIMM
jgi:hypothetical protein